MASVSLSSAAESPGLGFRSTIAQQQQIMLGQTSFFNKKQREVANSVAPPFLFASQTPGHRLSFSKWARIPRTF